MSPANFSSSAPGNVPLANKPDIVFFSSSIEAHPARASPPNKASEKSVTRALARKGNLNDPSRSQREALFEHMRVSEILPPSCVSVRFLVELGPMRRTLGIAIEIIEELLKSNYLGSETQSSCILNHL
jgi:hypothetical protein